MKKILLTTSLAIAIVSGVFAQDVNVTGDITTNTTWKANKMYLLNGFVYVKNGATLTIEPGTVIKGDAATKGSLIITRGAKIMAEGTAAQPIVFTSAKAIGQRAAGDWGGLIILGKAPLNIAGGEGIIEGGVDNAAGDGKYGGTNTNDNSGSLKYVRVEFGGIAFQPNNEINGITFGGVGAGTKVDYVQVSYSGDDSFEWFGGSVNCKHLFSYKPLDDNFDTDNGFSGKVQFGVSLVDPAIADQSGSNGFESDNDATGSTSKPYTSAIFSNMSIIGPKATSATTVHANYKRGAHLRRNTMESIYNTIIAGYPFGMLIDGKLAEGKSSGDSLQVTNTIIAGCGTNLAVNSGSTFDISTWFNMGAKGNSILVNNTDLKLADAFNQATPSFLPTAGSPALGAASYTNVRLTDAFFDKVTHIGAFGTDNWLSTWANYDPQNVDYKATVTGINETSKEVASVNVYPNPTNGIANLVLNLNTSASVKVNILDVAGKAVKTVATQNLVTGVNTIQVNTEELTEGMYFVQATTAKGTVTAKLSVVK